MIQSERFASEPDAHYGNSTTEPRGWGAGNYMPTQECSTCDEPHELDYDEPSGRFGCPSGVWYG